MPYEYSVALIAVAFAALAVFAILAIRRMMRSLDETSKTLSEVRAAVSGLSREAEDILGEAALITEDVRGKIKAVDPIVATVQEAGEVLHTVAHSVKEATASLGSGLAAERPDAAGPEHGAASPASRSVNPASHEASPGSGSGPQRVNIHIK